MNGSEAGMTDERVDVAIVGAGPVGLASAIELARLGIGVVLLDAKDGIAWSSRAICISRRSMEILDRIGAGAAFAAKALPWSRGRSWHRDRLVFRLEMPYGPGDRHAPFVNLQQYYTERFLLDRLGELVPPSAVRWNHRVVAVAPDATGVALTIETPEGARRLRADWLIAADGGRSVVREQMGLTLRGTAYESRYLIADIAVDGVAREVERNVWFDSPANPGSTVILHVQPDGIWRIDCQLRDEEDAEAELAEDRLHARLQKQLDMMGVMAPWRLVWKSLYKALALSLDSYRHGRVLFAGDAAHLVPIFGVRGLNSGFDDAHNLGWKLALVARGAAPAALLDAFSAERRGATAENHAQASKSTWFMSPPGPGFRRMRDAALVLAGAHGWASGLINPRQSSFHVYADSPGIVADAAPEAGVAPGAPLPDAPVLFALANPGHLHAALPERGFALVVFVAHLDPGWRAAASRIVPPPGVALTPVPIGPAEAVRDPDGSLAARFAAARFPVLLVRPDEHVAARFAAIDPAAIAAALEVALGRATAPAVPRPAVPEPAAAGLGQAGLETVFEALSRAIEAEPAAEADLLARLALLLAEALGDPARVTALIAEAGRA
ncbi:MAG: FAD-dependent monooxygenase [Rhodospirillales bacterium]|nr:FAD-dependent monooxygenase [Rhodospirillales bacterium]